MNKTGYKTQNECNSKKKDENVPFFEQFPIVTQGQIQAPGPHIQKKIKPTKIIEQMDTAHVK